MSIIKRNTDPFKGPPDGVEANIKCAVTLFERAAQKKGKGKTQREIKSHNTLPCHVMCSYSDGQVGISIRSMDLMISLRIDELFEIMKAAAEASQELTAAMCADLSDDQLEELWRELSDIPFDEADSPSGLILSHSWRHFPKGVDREDIWHWFDEHHSKGITYLLHGGADI